jgi:malonyl-CoA/methylmalonyl-CoA synthetase
MRRALHGRTTTSLLGAIASHPREAPALSAAGQVVTYGDLARAVLPLSRNLQRILSTSQDEDPARVAFLAPPNPAYVRSLIATWVAGCAAVPLSPLYPPRALAGIVDDAAPEVIMTAPPYGPVYQSIVANMASPGSGNSRGIYPQHLSFNDMTVSSSEAEAFDSRAQNQLKEYADGIPRSRPAILLFTSGTTGTPKGVVWTHAMLDYQVATLADQWRWSSADHVLNVLPLHHVHGIVNVLLTSLYAGAQCTMLQKFKPQDVWNAILAPPPRAPTVFMAVPTIYQRLIRHYNESSGSNRAAMRKAASALRLYVCGSAALGTSDYEAWREITGHDILERYGMTEAGMIMSNLYEDRSRACLGVPLPGVEVRVVPHESARQDIATKSEKYVTGQLLVRGPGVFARYWRRPSETSEAFTGDGWFKTGDIIRMEESTERCYMVGRISTDFVKSGGYKISALELELVLDECPLVLSSAVFGVDDQELGQRVVCAIIPAQHDRNVEETVRSWLSERLPRYKVPREIHVMNEFPRNTLGKVQKQELARSWAK